MDDFADNIIMDGSSRLEHNWVYLQRTGRIIGYIYNVRSYLFYGSVCSSSKWRNSCLSVWTMVCKFGLTLSKLHVLPIQDILLLTEWSWMTCAVNWVILLWIEFFLVFTCSALGWSNAWLEALEFKSVSDSGSFSI